MTIKLSEPRMCIRTRDGRLIILFQDPATCEDLAVIDFPREFAATLAVEFASIAPRDAKPAVHDLNEDTLS